MGTTKSATIPRRSSIIGATLQHTSGQFGCKNSAAWRRFQLGTRAPSAFRTTSWTFASCLHVMLPQSQASSNGLRPRQDYAETNVIEYRTNAGSLRPRPRLRRTGWASGSFWTDRTTDLSGAADALADDRSANWNNHDPPRPLHYKSESVPFTHSSSATKKDPEPGSP